MNERLLFVKKKDTNLQIPNDIENERWKEDKYTSCFLGSQMMECWWHKDITPERPSSGILLREIHKREERKCSLRERK